MSMPVYPDRFARSVLQGLPLSEVRVVDCHAHVGHYASLHIPETGMAEMIATADRLGIETLCLSALEAISADYRRGNDCVSRAMLDYPGRVRGYVVVNPHYPEEILPEIERCFAAAPFIGLKFHPAGHEYPSDGPAYEAALAYAHEHGLVVLSHNWGSADYLDRVSQRYPRAHFIQAHSAAAWRGIAPLDYLRVAKTRPNVFLDLALSMAWYGALERAVAEAGSEHLLFGTDAAFLDPAVAVGRIAFAQVPDEDKVKILGLNMLGIIGEPLKPV
jgi:predicted TIM-barrel fold metal-dependent hydrolase